MVTAKEEHFHGEGIHSVMRAVYSGECPHLKNERFQVNREPCSLDPRTNKNKKTPNQQEKKSKKKEMKLKKINKRIGYLKR